MSNILLVIAVILFVIAGLISGGVFSGAEPHTLAYWGLGAFAAAHLPLP